MVCPTWPKLLDTRSRTVSDITERLRAALEPHTLDEMRWPYGLLREALEEIERLRHDSGAVVDG